MRVACEIWLGWSNDIGAAVQQTVLCNNALANIGYARVSTGDQDLALQEDALRAAECEPIYSDRISGAKTARPELDKALAYVRRGDTFARR